MKFGKVEKTDLEMKVYAKDTSATAVILCSYGHFSGANYLFTRKFRIKILKKEGTSFGNWVFYAYSKANFKGVTLNLEDGQIKESPLESESIFKERVFEDYFRFRVAMPNVKEGSIIDIQYTFYGIPLEWRFQEEVPVLWNELIMEPFNGFRNIKKTTFGNISFAEQSDIRWVAKDVPAFKPEPFISSAENYIGKFEFDFSRTWESLNNVFDGNWYFGKTLQLGFFLNNIIKDIEAKYTEPLDKLKAAYDAVKVVKWNQEIWGWASNSDLNYTFKKKIGNSTDINLILTLLIKKLGFEVYPVVMSTRENGEMRFYSPSIEKINYSITCVKLRGKVYLLDASEEFMPFGLLPLRCLNEKGRIISENYTDWVPIIADRKDKKLVQYELNLDTSDILSGKIKKTRIDYSAFDFRKAYKKFNSQEEYLNNFEKENSGLIVDNCNIKNLDSIYNPLIEEYDVKIKNKVSRVGDLLYINPLLFEQISENPFKLEERKYPIDFAYPRELFYQLKLTVPNGTTVEQLPKTLVVKLSDNQVFCSFQISYSNQVISLLYRFQLSKIIFQPIEYYNLKNLYTEIVKKHSEPIVLKKISQ